MKSEEEKRQPIDWEDYERRHPPIETPVDGRAYNYVQACECGAWSLKIWKWDDKDQVYIVPYKCRSWRHEGECRLWRGAQDFVRIREGMQKLDDWTYIVLTFYQPPGADMKKMYKDGMRKWSALRKRIIRSHGKFKYVQTWERHDSGFPHVNLAISNREMWLQAIGEPEANFREYLMLPAFECGFGQVGWMEKLKSKDQMAGYLVKLARELTGAGIKNQIPTNAPKHFRRIRASQHTLPAVYRSIDVTGVLRFISSGNQ